MTQMQPERMDIKSSQAFDKNGFSAQEMVTLQVRLHCAEHELALALPSHEWVKLVSDFKRMPVDERGRLGDSIRMAAAENPFPRDGSAMDLKTQEKCDIFVSDCVLLAALAEAVGPRVLMETAVDNYRIMKGNMVKGRLN